MPLNFTTEELNYLLSCIEVGNSITQCYLPENKKAELIEYLESARESDGPVYDDLPLEVEFELNPMCGLIDKNRCEYTVEFREGKIWDWQLSLDTKAVIQFTRYDDLKTHWERVKKGLN
jgi:hypothetical protein